MTIVMTRFTRHTPGPQKNQVLKTLQRKGLERIKPSTYADPDGTKEDTEALASKLEEKIPYYSNLIVFYVSSEDWSNAYILQGPEPYIDERQLHFQNLNQESYG